MTTFSYTKPTVGGSEDTWGTTLNDNWDALGTFLGALDSTELAVLDGITATTAELNILDGVTVALADITATAAELNKLDGVTVTTAEINYLDGVTSAIQTQFDSITQPPELTQVQVEDDTSTVFGQVSGQRLAQAFDAQTIQFSALGTIAAGAEVKLSKDSLSSRAQNTFAQIVKVGVFQSGSVRLTLEQERGGFGGSSIVEVLKNGVSIQSWSTSSTSFVSRSLDISVAVGDSITVQHRHSDDNSNTSEVQLIRFQTTGDSIWPLFTIGIEDVSV